MLMKTCRTGVALIALAADLTAFAAAPTEVVFEKPVQRWLWGGFGFHDSEATMLPMMSQEFRDERVYKTFREISPTYARVFAGYPDWTKEAMDSFADFYDETFRRAGTTIYMVPGRFPYIHRDFSPRDHFERIATNLSYLVNVRKLTKLRYYAIANELSVGNAYCWFDREGRMDLYRDYCEEAYCAFKRHGLDIGLQTTDRSCDDAGKMMEHFRWAVKNVDEVTDTYCWHHYDCSHQPGDPETYTWMYTNTVALVRLAGRYEKRVSLGEYGMQGRSVVEAQGRGAGVMRDDGTFSYRHPERQHLAAIARVEMGIAAMNAGAVSAVNWTMFDYPDPFLKEDGDSPEEKGRYDVARFSGHGLQIRYNKCGLVRWDDEGHDYSARADLYTMGYLAKLFRKGARVLVPKVQAEELSIRAGAVTNPDGSCSVVLINWGGERDVRVKMFHPLLKPMRLYVYDSARPPYNAFNDLQPASGTVRAEDGSFVVKMPAQSLVFATTDYRDRVPPAVKDVRLEGGRLTWRPSDDPDHVYYRVYRNGEQVASTVAAFFARQIDASATYDVRSVDRWGNVGVRGVGFEKGE